MIRTLAVCCFFTVLLPATAAEVTRYRDADGQVVAARVADAALLHTAQLVPETAEATDDQQVVQVLRRLEAVLTQCGAGRGDVVKLNVYVRDGAMRAVLAKQLDDWFGEQRPAVSYVASPLPRSAAAVGLDAVVAVDAKKYPGVDSLGVDLAVLPLGDAVYVSGQAESGNLRDATAETMAGLVKTIEFMGLSRSDIVQVKCFIKPISDVAVADEEIARAMGEVKRPVVHVEWTSTSRSIEIELIVAAPHRRASDSVSYITPPWMKPSPVYSRVARIHGGERIYVAGLYPKQAVDGAAQVRSIFAQLRSALETSGSDLRHLAKATYYVADDEASGQLNQLRPMYYDPERPPAASKAAVKSVAGDGLGITIDMIAAPAARSAQ